MTWSIQWQGRATDYDPSLLHTDGKPGRVAAAAREAIWDAVQTIAEQDAQSWANVSASGWEQPGEPGLGSFNLQVTVSADVPQPQEGEVTPTPPEPARSALASGDPDA